MSLPYFGADLNGTVAEQDIVPFPSTLHQVRVRASSSLGLHGSVSVQIRVSGHAAFHPIRLPSVSACPRPVSGARLVHRSTPLSPAGRRRHGAQCRYSSHAPRGRNALLTAPCSHHARPFVTRAPQLKWSIPDVKSGAPWHLIRKQGRGSRAGEAGPPPWLWSRHTGSPVPSLQSATRHAGKLGSRLKGLIEHLHD